eukprot:scaffold99618_cov39-Tisochrysis_lutea.AAC.4
MRSHPSWLRCGGCATLMLSQSITKRVRELTHGGQRAMWGGSNVARMRFIVSEPGCGMGVRQRCATGQHSRS